MSPESNFESTNIWDYKPQWCQPWSIILTGVGATAASWVVFHLLWITGGVSLLIALWWVYFLVVYPKAFAEYVTSQQKESNANL